MGSREIWKCPRCKSVLHRSGCFVATVTYGDEDEVEVRFLRAFRDEVLSRTGVGRVAIRAYYMFGPYFARIVELLPPLRHLSRTVLDAIVKLIERTSHLTRRNFRSPKP